MQNFWDQFAAAAARFPGRTAIEVQRRDRVDAVTYRDLEAHAGRIAAALAGEGLERGDRCGILAENDAAWCAAYLAVLRLGAVAVPLDTAYKPAQVATLLRDSGARVVFTGTRQEAGVREAVTQQPRAVRVVRLDEAGAGGAVDALPDRCPATLSDPAVILYTSGTTADPKGVVLTHGNLIAERTAVFDVVRVSETDCVLGVLPLFHALAQMANLLLPLSIGARVVFLETVNTTELLRALAERSVTIFACVPQFFYLVHQRVMDEVRRAGLAKRAAFRLLLTLNRSLRRLGINAGRIAFGRVHRVLGGRMRLLVTGGSRFDPAVGADLYDMGFDILQAYGLTETSGAATLMRPGDRHLHTVGPPLPGVDIRIAPSEATLDRSGEGEVLIRGPVVMSGYFNRPDATGEALRDGWLHTGDLGRLEAGGRLVITGRIKELIVLSSGKNIYPEEIEAHYRGSPVIKEICVLGLTAPGEPAAERLYAVVVPDGDVLRERRIVNAGDLVRFEMESRSIGLPPHKRVLGYEIRLDPLPRTTTGKLKRFEIERRLSAARHEQTVRSEPAVNDEERRWLDSPEVAPLVAVIRAAAVRSGGYVTPGANLELDLGLDSMERVELLTALEQRFGAHVPDPVAERTFTVRELVEAVLAHRGTGAGEHEGNGWEMLLRQDTRPSALPDRSTVTAPLLFLALQAALGLFRAVARIEVAGREHLPSPGPLIVSPNHQSYIDVFVVVGLLPYPLFRQLFYVGASEYFQGPLLERLARMLHVLPIDPDAALVPAMQASAAGLREGRVLMLFPEGERSIDGTVRTFKKGAAILAHHLDAPIVPVALDGLFEVWPRGRPINWRMLRPWRRVRVAVRFGAPIVPEVPAAVGGGAAAGALPAGIYAQTTARVRHSVAAMWDEIHRDT